MYTNRCQLGSHRSHNTESNLQRLPEHVDAGNSAVGAANYKTSTPSPKGRDFARNTVAKRLGFEGLGTSSNSTVILRNSPLRRRTSLQALPSIPSLPRINQGSSVSSAISSKSSAIGNDSTRKTSVDSRFSEHNSAKLSPTRRRSRRHPWSKSSPEGGTLQTIDESFCQPHPTILSVENASAARIFFETYFHTLLNKTDTRTTRLRCLEANLYYSPHLQPEEKAAIRLSFYRRETCYLRTMRALQARTLASLENTERSPASQYDNLKILGRGSFGVVKLVREKDSISPFSQRAFAMKVIRKSEMIRSCQEGHLRAERDFLVDAEGSSW